MKVCNLCGAEKLLSEFHRHKSYKDGHRSLCKACLKARPKTDEQKASHVRNVLASRARNLEKARAYQSGYRAKHRDQLNAKSTLWRKQHAEAHRSLVSAWSRANPGANAVYLSRRRARKMGNGGSHTDAEWRERVAYFNACCAYCLTHESECGPLTRDHFTALAIGGSDGIENIVPACATCNSRKGPRPLFKFLQLEYTKCL